jgi:hypothetical protein
MSARVLWMKAQPPTAAQAHELALLGLDCVDIFSVINEKLADRIGMASGTVMEEDRLILDVFEWIKPERYDAIVWGPVAPEFFTVRFFLVLGTMEEIHQGNILPSILVSWEDIPGHHHHFMKV